MLVISSIVVFVLSRRRLVGKSWLLIEFVASPSMLPRGSHQDEQRAATGFVAVGEGWPRLFCAWMALNSDKITTFAI